VSPSRDYQGSQAAGSSDSHPNWFTADIVEMLDVIDGQIAVLEEFGTEDSSSKLGV
jgi:hypothetical protein